MQNDALGFRTTIHDSLLPINTCFYSSSTVFCCFRRPYILWHKVYCRLETIENSIFDVLQADENGMHAKLTQYTWKVKRKLKNSFNFNLVFVLLQIL